MGDGKHSLAQFAAGKLAALEASSLRRGLTVTSRGPAGAATRGGRALVSFCCNDYLGLSQHPAVKQAAAAALAQYGAGSGASRLVTGNHPLYEALEAALARIKGTEAACVFGSGYLANLGIVPAFAGAGDLILADELSHASMHAGIVASRAEAHFFAHNDAADCRRLLEAHRGGARHCIVMTEGVFSMDGDRAPLAALADLADEFDAWLMTDDAHGLGVLGGGRGSAAEAGVAGRVALQMGTLSKAVGSYGGYLCAARPAIELLASRARSLVYSTALPPASVAASYAALDLIEQGGALVAAPLARARRFTAALNLPEAESPIVPLIVGDPARALAASSALEQAGFLVTAIRPPTVPAGTARLRFTFAADHAEADIDRLVTAVRGLDLAGA
ncbi:MAG: 8-amino-7-oxononanoate synthase [Alphaproteobacteria bacterium]|nr:8-amino-7-oxononanoate synthase [Alphaproteobacteria bacterium]